MHSLPASQTLYKPPKTIPFFLQSLKPVLQLFITAPARLTLLQHFSFFHLLNCFWLTLLICGYLNVFINLLITLLIKFISPYIWNMLVSYLSGRLVKLHTLERTWNVGCQSNTQIIDLEIRQDIVFLSFFLCSMCLQAYPSPGLRGFQ